MKFHELRCSKCGALIETGAEACDICGSTTLKRASGQPHNPGPGLPIDVGPVPPRDENYRPAARGDERCAQCGSPLRSGAPACPSCGKRVPGLARAATPVIVGVLGGIPLGIVLGVAGIGGVLFESEFGLRTVIATAIVLPVAMILTGLALLARGKPAFGTFLMVAAGIGLTGPLGFALVAVFAAFTLLLGGGTPH
jgi:hypothetical protein